jgi:hypothetical protein
VSRSTSNEHARSALTVNTSTGVPCAPHTGQCRGAPVAGGPPMDGTPHRAPCAVGLQQFAIRAFFLSCSMVPLEWRMNRVWRSEDAIANRCMPSLRTQVGIITLSREPTRQWRRIAPPSLPTPGVAAQCPAAVFQLSRDRAHPIRVLVACPGRLPFNAVSRPWQACV